MCHVQTLNEASIRLLKAFTERRRTRRFTCGDTVQIKDSLTRTTLATAVLANISQGGAGFRSAHGLTPGTVVILRTDRLEETATVRHSTRTDSGFLIGCEFDRPLLALWL